MGAREDRDEYLERLWKMKEGNRDHVEGLKEIFGADFDLNVIRNLAAEGLVDFQEESGKIELTVGGETIARHVIRAHRLAERLLYDALGDISEETACEFEHTVAFSLVDGICTMLGHPRFCPHGMMIPEGACCKKALKMVESSVIPLSDMKVGDMAFVAYINSREDRHIHRLNSLNIRPGVALKMHQTYPAFVVECEGNMIALDQEMATQICLWRNHEEAHAVQGEVHEAVEGSRKRKGFGWR